MARGGQSPWRRQTPLNDPIQKEIVRSTPAGPIQIRSFCTPDEIQSYRFDDQFGAHAQYKSIFTKRETLEKHAAKTDANVVLALTEGQHIVGFGVFSRPEADERWTELGPGMMMEVKAVEVSRSLRSCKIAGDLLRLMLDHPTIERMIAYMVGYSWTWDLDGSGMNAQQYRNVLIRLFSPHGFIELQTNEPNICLKPENLFMGRIGSQVPDPVRQDFKWLRFGVSP
jgi:acetoin utilization protein AcuA